MSREFVSRWMISIRSAAVVTLLWCLGIGHRFAFWLDEWLFPSLHDAPIRQPLFVFGLPRSGTTLMQRLLAAEGSTFTTPPLWEVLLAPALCEKYFFQACYRLDRVLGGLGYRCVNWLESWGKHSGSSVHATTLQTPEEDFLALLPFGGCFLMVLVWPHSERVWRLAYFREQLPEPERQRLLRVYRGIVVRHLMFRGGDKTYLSKSPSFTGWGVDLQREFPDARFMGLRRDPTTVVASQLSSLEAGFKFFGFEIQSEISLRFVKMLARYWHLLTGYSGELGADRFQLVEYGELTKDQFACVTGSLRQLGYTISSGYEASLASACRQAASYRSSHNYSLEKYHLDRDQVLAEFEQGFTLASQLASHRSEHESPIAVPKVS